MPVTKIARSLDKRVAVEFTSEVLATCRRELAVRSTVCEYHRGCKTVATTPYRTKYAVVYLCDIHYDLVDGAVGTFKSDLDRALSEHMYSGLLRKSYVWLNVNTGGQLDKLVDVHEAEVKATKKLEHRRNVATIQQQRGIIAENETKIGAPDEDLMTGRDRNDLREKFNTPRRGPAPSVPTVSAVPTASLPGFEADTFSLITPTL